VTSLAVESLPHRSRCALVSANAFRYQRFILFQFR
jgi:hypothetical protein